MFCKYCGNQIEEDAAFCNVCGKPVSRNHRESTGKSTHTRGKYQRKEKHRRVSKLCVIGIVILCIGVCGLGFGLMNSVGEDSIATVQNGYLGEYTDITVKEILYWCYGMLHEKEEWDGGITDSGSEIVQVKYYDEGMEEDATTIQFTMLNEQCFKITAFVDPMNPVEKPTDLLATMNYNYLTAYMGIHRSVAGDLSAEKDLVARLGQISGSAVAYGASADYSGDRTALCEIDGQTPLNVDVAMLLDSYGLFDMSYYSGTDAYDQVTTEPYETEAALTQTQPSQVTAAEADTLLLAVLKGEMVFLLSDTNEHVTIQSIKRIRDSEFDNPLVPASYTYVDMDQDGQQEIIVQLDSDVSSWRLVLRYQDGSVYGYGYPFRGLQSISVDGLCMSSLGAAYSDVFRLRFDGNEVREEYLPSIETENALNNWVDVSWSDYQSLFSDSAPSEEVIEEYPLDFVNGNTGDVVRALGENYIYGDGYAGCKLFYYGSNPDISYGFVPLNWEDPVLSGTEPITSILLRGDAKICANLSANMNKTELDAVAWETPNVQNVSNGKSNELMSGNIYRYEIETDTAMIMYTWYLDLGDDVEYAASEVMVAPK